MLRMVKGKRGNGLKITYMGFEDLRVWQESMDVVDDVYQLLKEGALARDFDLKSQMRRAAVSIPSNIAEGDELDTNKQANRHFYIARGSSAELRTQLLIAKRQGYISDSKEQELNSRLKKISSMLYRLIQARK